MQRLSAALADRYRIERELGAGGMATVYLAHDVRHDRKVALKVLRAELSAILGAERFLKEIRTTANLQHPHILPLHDSGEADGVVYYVMPYVEGESLRDRLVREKQLPVDDAVRIGREVAGALDYAHRHNVVHRDIKPENILLHDGQALVADFGIALAAARTEGSARLTETGMSLGTPQYMAPEQAMGEREITPKADIYALGCVLYEMLVGEPPFTGPTAQAIIARVVTEEVRSLTVQRHTIPTHVEAAVRCALEKLPADRFASAAQFAEALAGGPVTPLTVRTAPQVASGARSRRSTLVMAGAAAGVFGLGALAALLVSGRDGPTLVLSRLSVTVPTAQRVSSQPFPLLGLSPDGSWLAYVVDQAGNSKIFLRRLDDPTPREVAGTDGACCPAFSPDNRWLFFSTLSGPRKVLVEGGSPVAVPAPPGVFAFVPGVESAVVSLASGHLGRLRADGGVDTIAAPDTGAGLPLVASDVLPNGRILAILGFGGGPLLVVDPRSGRRDTLLNTIVTAALHVRGYLVWAEQSGTAFGARLHRSGRQLDGPVVTIDPSIRTPTGGFPAIATSRSGVLAYLNALPSELVHVDRAGRVRQMTTQQRRFHSPRVSPDGRWVAVDFTEATTRDVWLLDRRDTNFTRLTFEPRGHDPMWTPDGRRVVFAAEAGGVTGIYVRSADGSGAAESILVTSAQLTAHSMGAAGQVLAVMIGPNGQDILTVPLAGERRAATPVLAAPYTESYPALSPDGRWLAYVSDESGRNEVYLRPFPGPGPRIIVSQNGGSEPVWGRGGRELFYKSFAGEPMLTVAVIETRPEPRVVSRTPLFAVGDYESAAPHPNYDVLPDGSGFVMIRQGRASEIAVVQNWIELVRRQSVRSR